MNPRFLILLTGLLLSACAMVQPSAPSQQAIYRAAMQAVAAHGETWSHDAAGGNPIQDSRDGTWRITVGRIDPAHTLIDIPTPAFFPGTVRELRFSREGALLSYKRSSQP